MTEFTSNNENEDIQEITGLVVHDFNLESNQDALMSGNMEEFRQKLRDLINYLLDKDFEKLLNAMYRLDINEEKFKKVVVDMKTENISGAIADLVIEREMQKVITRRKYRERNL